MLHVCFIGCVCVCVDTEPLKHSDHTREYHIYITGEGGAIQAPHQGYFPLPETEEY